MEEKRTKTMQLLNEFRSKCRAEKREFTTTEFRTTAVFGGFSLYYITMLLQTLVKRGYVTKRGSRRYTFYSWNPLYKNADKLEEYAAINPNSWETIFNDTTKALKTHNAPRSKEPAITPAKAIAYLKEHCPNLVITEKFTCADGTEYEKRY